MIPGVALIVLQDVVQDVDTDERVVRIYINCFNFLSRILGRIYKLHHLVREQDVGPRDKTTGRLMWKRQIDAKLAFRDAHAVHYGAGPQ